MAGSKSKRKKTPDPKTRKAAAQSRALIRSYNSLVSFLSLVAYASLLGVVYAVYLAVTARGGPVHLAGILFALSVSGGLIYSARLLSQRDRKALDLFALTLAGAGIVVLIFRQASGLPLAGWTEAVVLILPALILIELVRLRRGGVLLPGGAPR